MRFHALLMTLALVLGGCAGVPEQTFNTELNALKTIALATPQYDEELLLRYRKDQLETVDAVSPLPIGKLFAYVAKNNRESEFTQNASTSTDVFANNLYLQLKQRLQKDDFRIVDTNLTPSDDVERDRNGLLKKIPAKTFNGADALLETTGRIGFTAAGRGKPFEPTLWVSVRLTSPDGNVLLQDQILYNPPETDVRGLLLHSTGDFLFDSQDAIHESPDIMKALAQATGLVSDELSFLLRGPVQNVK